eukprot:GHRR01029397.1.p2 GENE.GHRR01029397.1~~GHRR01029397.1.p2  ORF type:complete len:125 (-),score=20.98 GHRR01029397.1:750-1124(-)
MPNVPPALWHTSSHQCMYVRCTVAAMLHAALIADAATEPACHIPKASDNQGQSPGVSLKDLSAVIPDLEHRRCLHNLTLSLQAAMTANGLWAPSRAPPHRHCCAGTAVQPLLQPTHPFSCASIR